MTTLLIAVIVVVGTSATCSLLEAVLYSVPISHVEKLAQEGRRSGHILRAMRHDVDRPIAAILSLNTIANTAGAAVAGAAAGEVFGHSGVVWFSAVLTLLILLFAEILPKTAGVVFSRPLAPVIAFPLKGLVTLMAPLVWGVQLITRLISRNADRSIVSLDELLMMVRLGGQTGTLAKDEAEAVVNLLSLRSKTVEDIMTPRTVVFSKDVTARVGDLAREAGGWPHGRVPVFKGDDENIVGIVHRRQVLAAVAENRLDITLADLMRPAPEAETHTPVDTMLRRALKERRHLYVVRGEFGGLAGVVTLEDMLEEAIGQEIVDEFDTVVDMREHARQQRDQRRNPPSA